MHKRQLDSQLQQGTSLLRVNEVSFPFLKNKNSRYCSGPQRQFQDKKEQDADSPGEASWTSGECHIPMHSCKKSHSQRLLNKLLCLHKAAPEAV